MKERLPGDLMVSILLAVVTPLLILLPSLPVSPGLLVLSLLLGYTILAALFPGREPPFHHRAGLILAFCLFGVMLAQGSWNLLAWDKYILYVLTASAFLTVVLALVAHFRRLALPRRRRFTLSRESLRSARLGRSVTRGQGSTQAPKVVLFIGVIAVISTMAYFMGGPEKGDEFTQFYVRSPVWSGEADIIEAIAGQTNTVMVNIVNHEYRKVKYTLKWALQNTHPSLREIELDHNQSWEGSVDYTPSSPGHQKLELSLFKDGDLSAPYKDLILWLNVAGIKPDERLVLMGNGSNNTLVSGPMGSAVVTTPKDQKVVSLKKGSSKSNLFKSSNLEPILLEIVSDLSSPQVSGERVFFRAEASDPEGDPLWYRFLFNDQAMTDWTEDNSWVWDTEGYSPGDYKVSVLVRDGRHAPDSGFDSRMDTSFTLSSINELPELTGLTPDRPSPGVVGSAILWRADAIDPEGDPLWYRFLLNDQAMTDWTEDNSWVWDTEGYSPGDYKVSVLVKEGNRGAEETSEISDAANFILMAPNRAPVLEWLVSDLPSPQMVGTPVAWKAKASDSDDDPLWYLFLMDDQPVTGWSRSGNYTWYTSGATLGNHQITVWVRDGRHASDKAYDSIMTKAFYISEKSWLNSSEIDKEIDAFISSRVVTPTESNQSTFKSQSIRLLQKNGTTSRAVLGASSQNVTAQESSPGSEKGEKMVPLRLG